MMALRADRPGGLPCILLYTDYTSTAVAINSVSESRVTLLFKGLELSVRSFYRLG